MRVPLQLHIPVPPPRRVDLPRELIRTPLQLLECHDPPTRNFRAFTGAGPELNGKSQFDVKYSVGDELLDVIHDVLADYLPAVLEGSHLDGAVRYDVAVELSFSPLRSAMSHTHSLCSA